MRGADISGSYSVFPSSASEHALMYQDLGGLIAGEEKQTVSARGQLKVVHLSQNNDQLAVSMHDETGFEVMNTTLSFIEQVHEGKDMVCVTRSWRLEKGMEGGRNSFGTLRLRMYREQDRLMISAESTHIFPKFLWWREKRYVATESYVFVRIKGPSGESQALVKRAVNSDPPASR